jgi:glycoside/pentoside/hexuronide:cation symporter, GPH family
MIKWRMSIMAKKVSISKSQSMITGKEKVSYGSYFVGQNIFYMLLFMYLVAYFTDIGIPAASVAVLALVVKVWDAVNDPIFGGIVDKVKFKNGDKFLPWLKVSLFAIPVATILLFAIPSTVSITVKIIWAGAAYILWDTAYTICDVPIFGIVTTMTDEQKERTSLLTIGRMCAMIAIIAVSLFVPIAKDMIGGWFPTAIVLSVVSLLTMIPICLTAKERIKPRGSEKETTFKEMLYFLRQNKYMLIFYGALLVTQSVSIAGTLSLYMARYMLGNEGLAAVMALTTIGPMLAVGFFIPKLVSKVDKYQLFLGAITVNVILTVMAYFVGYNNFTAFMVMLVLRGIPMGIMSMLMYMFTPDCAEYGTFKTGISAPGISFSIQTFTIKLTSAISTALGAACLAFIGFVEGEGAVQVAGFADKLFAVTIWVPAVGLTIGAVILSFYKLRDKDVQIMAKCNAGEISREEAYKALEGVSYIVGTKGGFKV